ncbi:kinase-like domain-containing protein [Hysterangium stoloniferum]|nr:kinase-like domain-containing protein [Hysterangium stoloniferum]
MKTAPCSPNTLCPSDVFSKRSSLCLDGLIVHRSKYPVAGGGFADIWTGKLKGEQVAIKIMRRFTSSGLPIMEGKMLKRIWREYLAWSSLSHPNILSCLGFCYDFTSSPLSELPALISPWMSQGTVSNYIANHPNANRLPLIRGIINGLVFLHDRSPAIIHGDIRAGNVLVSDEGIPCLTDFGLSRILDDSGMRVVTTSMNVAGSLRWTAPELLSATETRPHVDEKSDIWAFGMTVLEILTGDQPYADTKRDPVVFSIIVNGIIPSRPDVPGMTDGIWSVCNLCWRKDLEMRPAMREILQLV